MTNEPNLTGNYGVIILPDDRTVQKANEIAEAALGRNSDFILSSSQLPHLTLFHTNLKSVPISYVQTLLTKIRSDLQGQTLRLDRVALFQGFFFFWYTGDETIGVLQDSHEESLSLSRFRDREKQTQDVSKGRILLNPQELVNVEQYGHPWVGDLFCPHITLGYGVDLTGARELNHPWLMTVAAVVFARVELPARIGEIVAI